LIRSIRSFMTMEQRFLSPKELAIAIGASESSLKRWADNGQLVVMRTAGGHRRIALTEAVRYIRQHGLPVVHPQLLGLGDLPSVSARPMAQAGADRALIAALKDGRADEVRGLLLGMYLAGRDVADLCDGPLTDAMHQVGDLWKHGPEGIHVEHRATHVCLQALHQLHGLFPPPEADAPLALGCAPEGDPYMLASLMAATVLAAGGWQEMNLGPNLPALALMAAIRVHRPALVWVSCSVEAAARDTARQMRQVITYLAQRHVPVLMGGRGLEGAVLDAMPGAQMTRSMAEVAAFARGLRTAAGAR
jgi:MerR family transcriptional regulator, light-induced transcriptional regulator